MLTNIYKVLWLLFGLSVSFRFTPGLEETPHFRKYFYAGGNYTTDVAGNHVFQNQMYVEQLTPIYGRIKPLPLVFIHGLAQTGTVRLLFYTPLSSHKNPYKNFSKATIDCRFRKLELVEQARRKSRMGILLLIVWL